MGRKKNQQAKSPKPSPESKSRLREIIIPALIGLGGTLIAALLGYWGLLTQAVVPIEATQTAEARFTLAAKDLTSTSISISTNTSGTTTPDSPTSTPTPNHTASPTLTPTPTATYTPTSDPYLSRGDCDEFSPPCTYRVRQGDYYRLIAYNLYRDASLATILMNSNRDGDGFYRELQRGDLIFIPSLDAVPPLTYPSCGNDVFPCQYRAYRGDTYEAIAQDFYRNTAFSGIIKLANVYFDDASSEPQTVVPDEGAILVVPVRPLKP